MVVLHVKPVALVHLSALDVVLQLGTAKAVGLATPPVPLPRIVLAACVAISAVVTKPVAMNEPFTVKFLYVGDG